MSRKIKTTFASTDKILRMPGKSLKRPCSPLSTPEKITAKIALIAVGFLKERIVVVVFTEREMDTIRIISLRKALKHERLKFEEAIRNQLDAN